MTALVSRVLLLATLAALTAGEAFLKSRVVSKEDVKQLFLSEFSGHADAALLRKVERFLQPLFDSLPKNSFGRLEPPMVRYALNRYFVQQHGWFVKGLDAAWSPNETGEAGLTLLKARAPAYIQSLFEEHLHGQGFGLRELAVYTSTLGDLIHSESIGQLEVIYDNMNLSTFGALSPTKYDNALEAFLVAFLLGGWANVAVEDTTNVNEMKKQLELQYDNYPETLLWMQDMRYTHVWMQASSSNPFVQKPITFDTASDFVVKVSHRFSTFQNLECHTLKRKLIDLEHLGTGRVRMADFYMNALAGQWEFMESTNYLRNQGALDETDPAKPSVIISNYMNSLANCLTASSFYAVCCLNECNDLLAHIERATKMPMVAPARIAEVVSNLQSDTVDAPRNLSSSLLARLDDIAKHHGESVPLHGRLFAQWMHHAYPRECPFPHLTGSFEPQTPEEFVKASGAKLLEATVEEMTHHALQLHETSEKIVIPWSEVEELIGGAARHKGHGYIRILAAVVALASFGLPLLRALLVASGSALDSQEKHLV